MTATPASPSQEREQQAATIAAWLRVLIEPGQTHELRALRVAQQYGRPLTVSGFFDDLAAMAREAVRVTRRAEGVYWSLNPVDPALKARRDKGNRTSMAEEGDAANDNHVLCRRWLLIDPDPVRVAKVSSTDAEKQEGERVTRAIREWLRGRGWPDPVFADSGNSFHLLYRIDLPRDDGGLLKRVLQALAARFNSDRVKIDQAVFNPARICKLYGTQARKGGDIPERPHRLSRVLEVPGCPDPLTLANAAVVPVPAALLEQLAAEAPAAAPPGGGGAGPGANGNAGGNGVFNHRLKVGEWLTARGVAYRVKPAPDAKGRTIYLLECCPFNPDHRGKDVAIFQWPNGKLGAHCFHNSCGGNGWQEFKEKIGKPSPEHYDPPMRGHGKKGKRKSSPEENGPAGDNGRSEPGESGESRECRSPRPEIVITVEEDEVNAQAAEALGRDEGIYQRAGLLSRVVRDNSPAGKGVRRPFAPRIDALPPPLLRERLAACARWLTVKKTKGGEEWVPAHPPAWCVSAVHARADWPGVQHLEAVIDYPVLRPGGTVLCRPGYDPDTGLMLEPAGPLPAVPEGATREGALAARDALLEVVADFPFERDVHRAAWLAGLLTPLARFAFAGPAPLFLVDANVRAAGKGLLLHATSTILTGNEFTVATYTDDEEELRKRITSLAMAGDRLVLFDNLAGKFGNAILDAALTSTSWEDRVLGGNRMFRGPLHVTWFATGNNVAIGADTARRVCHVRLESPEERPEERKDFRHPDLLAWVARNRGRLLAAALTILRGYCAAGRPDQGLPAWGSFEGWSGLVRSAVVWAGMPDPGQTRLLLQEQADVAVENMAVVLACWEKLDPDRRGLTAAEVIQLLYKAPPGQTPEHHADLKAALEALLGKPDSRSLGNRLRSYRRRVFQGRFIDQAGEQQRAARWAVYPAKDFGARVKKTHETHQTHPAAGESGESRESIPPGPAADEEVI
jgi:hypothetical protein